MEFFKKWKKILEDKGYWEILSYLFFGGATTVVNMGVFFIANAFLHHYIVANTIAWFISVLFAFVTNKIFVFQTKSETAGQLVWEWLKFMFYRILSLGIDNGSLYVIVDVFKWNVIVGKLVSQVLVVVANYAFSKLFIFKKTTEE
ncbi:GtrA family protein [Enterococcus sp. HY326]|uniref:GtrA family protein n=1 Tax=Enterococcus sp. HY326 TaxID=2971265 RepID=UPI00223F876E|nr:GtrA family protein [Enterococcus sp. HY326]